jgi:hypothetical protein
MDKPLYLQIQELEAQLDMMKTKLDDISKSTEEKDIKPYSTVGGGRDRSNSRPADTATGLGQVYAGGVIWNDSEQNVPQFGTKPNDPTRGYNRHSHSRMSGGALEAKTLEIVEYDTDWNSGIHQKDCQSSWKTMPPIKKQQNTSKQDIEKVGQLALTFDADAQKWGVSAFEIDVAKCYLVQRDKDGSIVKDVDGNDKKSLLYNEDATKTNVVWDKTAKCWRFYATYAEAPATPTP